MRRAATLGVLGLAAAGGLGLGVVLATGGQQPVGAVSSAGPSPQALASLRANGRGQWVYNADEFRWGHYFHRIRQRNAPHNLYTDGANLRRLANAAGARDVKAPKASWKFGPAAPLERRPKGG